MTVEDRSEWLAVAVDSVANWPREVLIAACQHARRTCQHPAQIVPTISTFAEQADQDLRRDITRSTMPRLRLAPLPPPQSVGPLTQEQVDAMQPFIRRLGLQAGWLIENDHGEVIPAPD